METENENKVALQGAVEQQNNAAQEKKPALDYEAQFLGAVDAVANGFISFLGAVFNCTVEKLANESVSKKLIDKISDGLSKPINDAVKLVTDELDK